MASKNVKSKKSAAKGMAKVGSVGKASIRKGGKKGARKSRAKK